MRGCAAHSYMFLCSLANALGRHIAQSRVTSFYFSQPTMLVLDGSIDQPFLGLVYIIGFLAAGIWIAIKRNPRPPVARYRKDGGVPWIAPWNLFDESKLTPEAIAYNRQSARLVVTLILAFIDGWLRVGLALVRRTASYEP